MVQAISFLRIEVAVYADRLVVQQIVFFSDGSKRLLINQNKVVSVDMIYMIGGAVIHQNPAFVNQP